MRPGKSWYRCAIHEGKDDAVFFIEVENDLASRQVEQYGDCWVYSGDPESYCHLDDFDAYGSLTDDPFSLLGELPFVKIERSEFECAWDEAKKCARKQPRPEVTKVDLIKKYLRND